MRAKRAGRATLYGMSRSSGSACWCYRPVSSPTSTSFGLLRGNRGEPLLAATASGTPDQARRKADEWRQVTKTGADPLQAKRELRAAPTVGEIIAAYLKSERYKGKAPTTQIGDLGRIRRHLLPLLGKKHVHTLTTEDVGRAFTAIRDGKTAARIKTGKRGLARVTGGEGTAKEAVKLLRSIFGWAINERLIKTNPAAHIKVGSSGTRDTILNGADDYARLFQALDLLEAQKKFSQVAADAIRLIALTGARRGEITGLRWSHVDLRQGLLTSAPSGSQERQAYRQVAGDRTTGSSPGHHRTAAHRRQLRPRVPAFIWQRAHCSYQAMASSSRSCRLTEGHRLAWAAPLAGEPHGNGRGPSCRDHDRARPWPTLHCPTLCPLGTRFPPGTRRARRDYCPCWNGRGI